MQIAKVGKDVVKYACAIYIVVNYGPHDIINYIKNYQLVIPFETGVERIKRRFIKPIAGECEIFCSDLKIEFKCNFTQTKIKVPVRGQWCEHDQCFDLETYVWMNQKPDRRKWICPCTPLDKPVILYRDEFMMRLLDLAKKDDVECSISENLEIKLDSDRIYKILGN